MDTNRNEDMEMRADAQRQPAAKGPMDDMPADALIIVPMRNMVLFPGLIAPLAVARPTSIAAAQEAVRSERRIGVLLQRNPDTEDPRETDLYSVGTVATVLRYVTAPDGSHQLVVHGEQRFRVAGFYDDMPFRVARIELLPDADESGTEIEARMLQVKERARELLELAPRVPPELAAAVEQIKSAGALADFISGLLDIRTSEKQ